jgi:hypothetical protein
MLTDTPPRNERCPAQFLESERLRTLDLPQDGYFLTPPKSIEAAMNGGTTADVRRACADFFQPYRNSTDYRNAAFACLQPDRCESARTGPQSFSVITLHSRNELIRVWMRTAVRKQVTSFGTFLSTICHEFCPHLDFQHFGFRDSWHTRGVPRAWW